MVENGILHAASAEKGTDGGEVLKKCVVQNTCREGGRESSVAAGTFSERSTRHSASGECRAVRDGTRERGEAEVAFGEEAVEQRRSGELRLREDAASEGAAVEYGSFPYKFRRIRFPEGLFGEDALFHRAFQSVMGIPR